MSAKTSTAADRQKILGRLVRILKKQFGGPPKREPLPVLETLIFALCCENATVEAAQTVLDRLRQQFFDWNEVRVSTIAELEPVFEGLSQPEYRAMRVRYLLFYVFDHQYSYDFDALRKKTLELAQKQLSKIKHLTPFARNYLLLTAMGNHVIPLDDRMRRVAIWLGLLPRSVDEEGGADALKSIVRKADGPEFFWLLKSLSVAKGSDLILQETMTASEGVEFDLADAEERLQDVLSGRAARRAAASAARKAAEKVKAAEERAKARVRKERAAARAAAKADAAKTPTATRKKTSPGKTAVKKKTATGKKTSPGKKAPAKKTASKTAAKKKTKTGRH